MVNPVVDGYTKALNYRKIVRKIQKYNNLLKTKRILKPKYKLREVRFSYLACQAERHFPPSVTSLAMIYCIYIQYKLSLLNCNKIRAGGVA